MFSKYAGLNGVVGGIEGYYYLHINGDLIFKRNFDDTWADLKESDFVKRFWPFVPSNRANAWIIVTEAKALGVVDNRIKELQEKWHLTDEDGQRFAEWMDIRLVRDGNQWCAANAKGFTNIQECDTGYGDDVLTACSELAKYTFAGTRHD